MSWRPETSTDPDDARPAFVTAMQEQLGLKLEPMRWPVEGLVLITLPPFPAYSYRGADDLDMHRAALFDGSVGSGARPPRPRLSR